MPNSNRELDAICWKCQQTGLSYGKLMQQCSPQDLHQICREYEQMRRNKKNRGEGKLEASPPEQADER